MAVPSSIEGITPVWLDGVLRHAGVLRDAAIVGVDVTTVGHGQLGESYRVVPVYDGPADGAPASMVVKLPSLDPVSRAFAGGHGLYANEVRFYQSIAARLDVRVPHAFHAAIDDNGIDFVVLMEDLAPAHACDQITGCTPDQAALAMEQAAAIHGPSWDQRDLLDDSGVNRLADAYRAGLDLYGAIHATFRERYAEMLEPEYLDLGDRLVARMPNWVTHLGEARCLIHVDFRLDNMLFDARAGAVPLAIVDWQSISVGPGVADAAYFVGAGLRVEDRERHEEALIRHYHDELLARGVTGYVWDECWAGYQIHAVMGFVTAVNASVNVKRTPRGDEMFMTMARRHGAQMIANDSLRRLEQAPA